MSRCLHGLLGFLNWTSFTGFLSSNKHTILEDEGGVARESSCGIGIHSCQTFLQEMDLVFSDRLSNSQAQSYDLGHRRKTHQHS